MEVANMTELLKYHDNTLIDKDLLPLNEQREQFLEMESTPGEDVVNIAQLETKDTEQDIHSPQWQNLRLIRDKEQHVIQETS